MSKFPRWLADNLKQALKVRRVVVISGARQTGKTTLAKDILNKDNIFRALDEENVRKAAQNDPLGFVKNKAGTMIIDEIQKVPELIQSIKYAVDNDNRLGQYLITGSANIQTLPSVTESLAGRVKHIRLRPLTQGEILQKKPIFLKRAFANDFPSQIEGYDKEAIFDIAFRGGFPEAERLTTQVERIDWHRDYIEALIKRDLKDVANIVRQDALKDLIEIMASWSGKFMDVSAICAHLGVSRPTITGYINALETLFLFDRVKPWIKTDYDRIGRITKTYVADTGFMTAVLGYKKDDIMLDTDKSGKIMETFVYQELSVQVELDRDYSLYQYRDARQREIDFLIERSSDGSLLGCEVKASHSVSKGDFVHQMWFKNNIVKDKKAYLGIVLYSGSQTLSFGEGMLAVPIAALWL
ncbi:MAG: ATP-binding protein [Endomicrobium sp.]|jgi:predicted AAA+ superfamily ATPase|nr:ATP-binding protein [Endomicrobium sp.]